MQVKAANGLVRILKKEGVDWVGTFPTNVFTNACGEEGVENKMLRDERFAVALADAYSRLSNGKQFGVCTIMGGVNAAGLQMAYGALGQAYEDGTPLLCLSDGVPSNIVGQERFNIEDAFKSVTKWNGYINSSNRISEVMRRAYTMLKNGRPGPVLVQLPRGLDNFDEEASPYIPVKSWKSQSDPRIVRLALRSLTSASKPLIIAGQGVFYADACEELRRFAELIQTPVLTTLKGKSAFPEDNPLSLGVTGEPAEHFLKSSDVVMAVGTSFHPGSFSHVLPKGKTVIQLNIDESDINRSQPVDCVLTGDAKLVLQQLIEEAEKHQTPNRSETIAEIEREKQAKKVKYSPHMESSSKPINPYRVYSEMAIELDPMNSFVTHESGNTRDQLVTIWETKIPHGFMGWGNVSTLGFGLAAAMGAKLAFPERQVVSVTGDAGFGYQVGNYEALVRLKMGITTVHINNSGFGGYGQGFWGPGHSPFTSTVTSSDVMKTWKVAEAVGMASERVEDPDEVGPALRRAIKQNASNKPAFIEVICSMQPVYGGWKREWI